MQLDLLQKELASLKRKGAVSPKKPPSSARARQRPQPAKNMEKEMVVPEISDIALTAEDGLEKAPGAFKTISEVAILLDVPQHVLRFWESRFPQIKPLKLRGGRRYYRPQDVDTLATIKNLLYKQGYTIKGAKKAFAKKEIPDAAPVETKKEKPAAAMSERQISQLSVIRQELIGLRDILKPHL